MAVTAMDSANRIVRRVDHGADVAVVVSGEEGRLFSADRLVVVLVLLTARMLSVVPSPKRFSFKTLLLRRRR